ncbi:MAG TPA: PAS domain S-box protein [Armatimonadota bacterium]|nr:PAS domain S-box protein [Armatimonadota bacterium]
MLDQEALRAAGLLAELARGALQIASADILSPDWLAARESAARAEGYTGLCLIAALPVLNDSAPQSARSLVEMVNARRIPALVWCDFSALTPGHCYETLTQFPLVFTHGILCRNPLHIPPPIPEHMPKPADAVERMLAAVWHWELATQNANAENEAAQKSTTQALRASEERFRAVFDSAPIGIMLVNPEGCVSECNQALQEMLGYRAVELRGIPVEALTYTEDRGKSSLLLKELLAGERSSFQIERRQRCKDGHLIWTRIRVSLLRDERGKPLYAVGMVEDITARKDAENALHASDRRYRSLVWNNHASILLFDPETQRVVDANPAACAFYGCSKAELTALKITDIRATSPKDALREMERAWQEQRQQFFLPPPPGKRRSAGCGSI